MYTPFQQAYQVLVLALLDVCKHRWLRPCIAALQQVLSRLVSAGEGTVQLVNMPLPRNRKKSCSNLPCGFRRREYKGLASSGCSCKVSLLTMPCDRVGRYL